MQSDEKTLADAKLEQQKWQMKFFDYAESPIKEWIALIIGKDVNELFDDYSGDSDGLSIQLNNKNYTFYLTATPTDTNTFKLKKEDLMNYDELRRATSMMMEAVKVVYPPIIKSMKNAPDDLMHCYPMLNERDMCFSLHMTNKYDNMRKLQYNTIFQIDQHFKKLREIDVDSLDSEKTRVYHETMQTLIRQKQKCIDELNKITEQAYNEQTEICNKKNQEYLEDAYLFIFVEINDRQVNNDLIMRRLPQFGSKYEDSDEEDVDVRDII